MVLEKKGQPSLLEKILSVSVHLVVLACIELSFNIEAQKHNIREECLSLNLEMWGTEFDK